MTDPGLITRIIRVFNTLRTAVISVDRHLAGIATVGDPHVRQYLHVLDNYVRRFLQIWRRLDQDKPDRRQHGQLVHAGRDLVTVLRRLEAHHPDLASRTHELITVINRIETELAPLSAEAAYKKHMKEAMKLSKEAETFIKGIMRDYIKERKDEKILEARYGKVHKTLITKHLGALHRLEIQMGQIVYDTRAHLNNALAALKWVHDHFKKPDANAGHALQTALNHINSARTKYSATLQLTKEIFEQTVDLKNTHDELVGHLEGVEEATRNLTLKFGAVIHKLETEISRAEQACH